MNIQSLSIVVPTKGCVNNCPCCVSKFDLNNYDDVISSNNIDWNREKLDGLISIKEADWIENQYINRLKFARNNGCNIMLITASSGEALQNRPFLNRLADWNRRLPNPFYWVEFQTTGVMLTDENLDFLKHELGVTTISLSMFDPFNLENNSKLIGIPEKLKFDFEALCKKIKSMNLNLRISINLTDVFNINRESGDRYTRIQGELVDKIKSFGADQLTLRNLYSNGSNPEVEKWIEDHPISEQSKQILVVYLSTGKKLERLDFGPMRYSIDGLSVVYDNNCMVQSGQENDTLRYLILREDCKLYSRWNDKASLIF